MDKKKTLLHVLMGWAKDKEPDLLKLDEDLIRASEASQWSLTDLKQQVPPAATVFMQPLQTRRGVSIINSM